MGELTDQKAREKLGLEIKKVRGQKNLSQLQLAEKSAITVTYYAQIERGEVNPSFDVLLNISRALKTKLSALIPF